MKDYKIIFVIQGKRSWYVAKLGSEPAAYAHRDLNTLEGLIRRDGHTFYHSWVNQFLTLGSPFAIVTMWLGDQEKL